MSSLVKIAPSASIVYQFFVFLNIQIYNINNRRTHLSSEPVKGFIKVEHPPSLANVGRPPLRGRRYSPPLLALLRIVKLGSGGRWIVAKDIFHRD